MAKSEKQKTGRIYYSMGEVAEMLDVKPSLVRFWERKFDIIKPDKNKKGNRLFTPADVENLKLIHHLVKEKGMTLAGAAKKMKENPEGIRKDMEIVESLLSIRAMLMEIREELKGEDDGEVFVDRESIVVESMVAEEEIEEDIEEEVVVEINLPEEDDENLEFTVEGDAPFVEEFFTDEPQQETTAVDEETVFDSELQSEEERENAGESVHEGAAAVDEEFEKELDSDFDGEYDPESDLGVDQWGDSNPELIASVPEPEAEPEVEKEPEVDVTKQPFYQQTLF